MALAVVPWVVAPAFLKLAGTLKIKAGSPELPICNV